jgi:tripartite-type tricarboxylate transporter receptor subunit TctC
MKKIQCIVAATIAAALAPAVAGAQDVSGFYKNKTLELYVGSDVGGGYNAYARTVGMVIGRYVPGKPDVVVKNMPGAGGRKLTGWLATIAPKDGSVVAASQPGSLVDTVLGEAKNAKYDPRTFGYVGSAESSVYLCVARKDAAVQTFQDTFDKQVLLGASSRGASTLDTALLLKNVLGVKFKMVKGYKGSHEVILAIERNEVQGVCGYAWSSLLATAGHLVKENKLNLLVQYAIDESVDATRAGVPPIWKFVKTKEQRDILELALAPLSFGRPFFVPANVPKERLAALRAAFDKTMQDADYIAAAKKQKLDVSPASGAKVQELIAKMYAAPKALQEKARSALYTE